VAGGHCVALLGALALYAAASAASRAGTPERAPIAIGSKAFTEQYILAEILREEIEARNRPRERAALPSLGSTVAFDALAAGDLDAYVRLFGNDLGDDPAPETLPTPAATRCSRRSSAISPTRTASPWRARSGFENRMRSRCAPTARRELGVVRVGELAPQTPRLEIGGDYEFFARAEWRALVATYQLAVPHAAHDGPVAPLYRAARATGRCDQRVLDRWAHRHEGFVVLEDDRHVIPPYDAIVLAECTPLRASTRGDRRAARTPRRDRRRRDAPHERRGRHRRPLARDGGQKQFLERR
jgi:osmoprotectant transport system permease protein